MTGAPDNWTPAQRRAALGLIAKAERMSDEAETQASLVVELPLIDQARYQWERTKRACRIAQRSDSSDWWAGVARRRREKAARLAEEAEARGEAEPMDGGELLAWAQQSDTSERRALRLRIAEALLGAGDGGDR